MSIKKQLPEVEPVHLKPFHGIRPGVYILALSFVAILILCFLLFLLPGLLSNTAYVTFDEPIMGSGVLEDGKYLGSGNGGVYKTTGGDHTYTFIYEGEEYGEVSIKIKRNVFFSLFSHKSVLITPDRAYSPAMKEKIVSSFLSSLSSYSALLSVPENFHYPPLFRDFALNAVETGIENIKDVWLFALSHVTSPSLYSDYLEGREILENNNVSFSSNALSSLEEKVAALFSGEESKIYRATEREMAKGEKDGDYFSYSASTFEMGRDSSLDIQSVKEAPVFVTTEDFSISSSLVTEHDWALFVADTPMWAKENLEELVSLSLVDGNYLKGITLSPYINSIRPIRSISYYSALAYIEWKSEKDGVEYHIPTEGEWYQAASSTEGKEYVTSLVFVENNTSSPTAMLGQLWEFTSTPFIPLMRLSDYEALVEMESSFNYDDIIIKGGSYVSDPSLIDIDTIGISTRSQCSEFCGLRLAKK